MPPKVTYEEPKTQGLLDKHPTACPIPIFWTEMQKGLLKTFTPGANFADRSLGSTYFETVSRLHFQRERLTTSFPGRVLERHEGSEGL